MDLNYKKYALSQLENWMHDVLSSDETTPEEIYNVIKDTVKDNYYTYKVQTERCYELLALLNGNGKGHIPDYDESVLKCDKDNQSPECKQSWNSFWKDEGKVKKWFLPVQQRIEEGVDDYYVQFPDDLLEETGWKEGDQLNWTDNGDGSWTLTSS
jgi:hypothetical protein